ncbi:MAG: autotransporter outer membrane beta-barrel domain-containing protein [Phormidesmis sp.]
MITRFGGRLARLATIAFGTLAGSLAISLAAQSPANAQAAYGSYIGIGPAFGDGEIGVAINGRYNILEVPISIRGAAFLGEGSAFVPTISYDYPLNFNTEIYVGAGVAFASDGSVMGDGTAFVLQPGVDFLTGNNLVFYGNAIVPFGGDTNTAVQGGIGYQF